jgi:hypothetical protein
MGMQDEPAGVVADPEWVRRFAQDHVLDEVLCAARCAPNAPGRHTLASVEAFGQRQLLKGAGRYHGERLILAVTARHLFLFSLSLTGRVVERLRWDRATVRLVPVIPRPGVPPGRRALLIEARSLCEAVELVERDPGSLSDLLGILSPVGVSGR